MSPLAQNLIAAAIVLFAVGYIALRSWRIVRGRKTGCGCAECPAVKAQPKARSAHPGP
jgi:hypothetical protein